MLSDPVKRLIRDEHRRGTPGVLDGLDVEQYIQKLDAHAECVSEEVDGNCRALVAFYCNDPVTKIAFITLVLVDPAARRTGLGKKLVKRVLQIVRDRSFTACRLEVDERNDAARPLYESLGFVTLDERGGKLLMEARL